MSDVRERLKAEVERSGAAAVARRLRVPRNSLVSYLAGTAREGTELVIEMRACAGAEGEPLPAGRRQDPGLSDVSVRGRTHPEDVEPRARR